MTEMKFTLQCPVCGGTKFQAPSKTPAPNDPITCSACGKKINLAEEKQRLEEEARRAIEQRLRGL